MNWTNNLERTWWMLRIAFGAVPFLAGLDKFFNILADWSVYLSPLMQRMLPFSGTTFMKLVGVIEMAAGILVFTQLTRLAAYVISIWLAGIALTLVASGMYLDVAVRDLVMALAAFTLASLTAEREAVKQETVPRLHAGVVAR